jgi:hypothetical protein
MELSPEKSDENFASCATHNDAVSRHFHLAKASFLQDMIFGMFVFVFYLAKASFLQNMLLGMVVVLYVIIAVQRVSSLNKPYIYIASLV